MNPVSRRFASGTCVVSKSDPNGTEGDQVKKKATRSWTLWVHKEMGMYFDPKTTPRLGGQSSCEDDFEWVVVREVRPRKRTKASRRAT